MATQPTSDRSTKAFTKTAIGRWKKVGAGIDNDRGLDLTTPRRCKPATISQLLEHTAGTPTLRDAVVRRGAAASGSGSNADYFSFSWRWRLTAPPDGNAPVFATAVMSWSAKLYRARFRPDLRGLHPLARLHACRDEDSRLPSTDGPADVSIGYAHVSRGDHAFRNAIFKCTASRAAVHAGGSLGRRLRSAGVRCRDGAVASGCSMMRR